MNKELLRFCVSGNVDDGKSTLIGRLLHDTNSLTRDQKEYLLNYKQKNNLEYIDYSIVTDGLFEERLQKITIDIAFRYFNTPNRKFIVIDTPGHFEFTRNMVTGASVAELAVIMVDAKVGVTSQTKRHCFVAALMGIKQLVVCVNKMDVVGYDEAIYNTIKNQLQSVADKLNVNTLFVPVSALRGDNVVQYAPQMPWYKGKTLLKLLEDCSPEQSNAFNHLRFSVQFSKGGYTFGKVNNGILKQGDEVIVFPSKERTIVEEIIQSEKKVGQAKSNDSVAVRLVGTTVDRGSWLIKEQEFPFVEKQFNAVVMWLDNADALIGKDYILMNTTKTIQAKIAAVNYYWNIEDITKEDVQGNTIKTNDICNVTIVVDEVVYYDLYSECKNTGSFILCDPITHHTVAAGIF